jgi:lipoate-protein ligase B
VKNAKIGSVGIAVRRSISFHGIALNVNTELQPFGWVNPCGLKGVQMISMKQILSHDIQMDEVRQAVIAHFERIFDVQLDLVGLDHVQRLLAQAREHGAPKLHGTSA